jgi:hypothetical protein
MRTGSTKTIFNLDSFMYIIINFLILFGEKLYCLNVMVLILMLKNVLLTIMIYCLFLLTYYFIYLLVLYININTYHYLTIQIKVPLTS